MRIAWELLRGLLIWPAAASVRGAVAPWLLVPLMLRRLFCRRNWYRCDLCGRRCNVDWTPATYGQRKVDGTYRTVGVCARCDGRRG